MAAPQTPERQSQTLAPEEHSGGQDLALAAAQGQPETYAPAGRVQVPPAHPFWSQRAVEEHQLRYHRPSDLPSIEDGTDGVGSGEQQPDMAERAALGPQPDLVERAVLEPQPDLVERAVLRPQPDLVERETLAGRTATAGQEAPASRS